MTVRNLIVLTGLIFLSFCAGGCGDGGTATGKAESPEAVKQVEDTTAENVKLQNNPLDVKRK